MICFCNLFLIRTHRCPSVGLVLCSHLLPVILFSLQDHGEYECMAVNSAGLAVSGVATLDVSKELSTSPKLRPPSVIAKPSNVTAPEGSDAILECLVDGYPLPRITWLDADLQPVVYGVETGSRTSGTRKSGNRFHRFGLGNLRISNVSLGDAAKYTCQACIPGTSKCLRMSAHLVVESEPRLTEKPSSVTKLAAETARFVCDFDASLLPKPKLTWFKDGRRLTTAGRVKLLKKDTNLVINQIGEADAGIYQCVLTNRLGFATAAANLFFVSSLEAPDPPEVTLVEVGSTSVTIKWKQSNVTKLPIVAYTVHYR